MEEVLTKEKKRTFSTYETEVTKIDVLSPRNKGLHFQLPAGQTLNFKAGQYVQVFVPNGPQIRRTAYSIASSPRQSDGFDLCVTLVDGGISSHYLHNLKPGDNVKVMGPLGVFRLPEPVNKDLVFIATGSGIAPFRSMIQYLFEQNTDRTLDLLFGNRYDDDILYKSEWDDLARQHGNFKVLFTLSRPTAQWPGPTGYVQTHIEDFVPDPKSKDFLICGLVKMINDVQAKLLSLGVPKNQIHYERYD
ncbi:MAG: FAD-dependent oxidoreductase [Elusimicrobia bacterium]|nr:FAD-dependent oxidoreductase [Candidatus Obscuribacterium magneticum]